MRIKRMRRIAGVAIFIVVAGLAGATIALTQIDPNAYRGRIAQRVQEATGREFGIAGPVKLDLGFQPAIKLNNVHLANADWGEAETFAAAKEVRFEIAILPLLWGNVRLRDVAVEAARLNLETGPAGRGNWKLGGSDRGAQSVKPSKGRNNILSGLKGLHVAKGKITYRHPGSDNLLTAKINDFTAHAGHDELLAVDSSLKLEDRQATLKGRIGAPARLLEPEYHYPVDLTLAGVGAELAVDGTVIDPSGDRRLDLTMQLKANDTARFATMLGLDRPVQEQLAAQTHITGTDGRFALRDLSFSHGKSKIGGRAVLKLTQSPVTVNADLTAATLDLTPWFAGSDAPRRERLFGKTPLAWQALKRIEGRLTLDAGTVRLTETLTLHELRGQAALRDGRLTLDPLRATLADGGVTLALTGDANAKPPALSLKAQADDVQYGRLLSNAGLTQAVTGRGRFTADVTTSGLSPHDMAANLKGRIEAVSGKGRIDSTLIQAASAGLAELLAPWQKTGKDVRLNCAIARFAATTGRLESQAILADTETASLGGSGHIDLGKERYDLRLAPQAKQTSLMSLAIPVGIRGPLTAPRIVPDPLGAAKAGAIAIGSLVNPFITLGALVIDSETADANPCLAALEKAQQKPGDATHNTEQSPDSGSLFESLSRSIGDALNKRETE